MCAESVCNGIQSAVDHTPTVPSSDPEYSRCPSANAASAKPLPVWLENTSGISAPAAYLLY